MVKKHQVTWAEVALRNGGVRAVPRAFKFALGWGLATAELGREPANVEEYADVMDESRATAFRDQQAFRRAFPDEVSPLKMNQLSGAQERYDELWRTLHDRKKVALEAQAVYFVLGAAPATG